MKITLNSRNLLRVALVCLPTMMLAQSNPNPAAGQTTTKGSANSTMNSNSTEPNGVAASDKKFVRDAAQGGLAEVELGKIATEKASSDDVKKFGQRMVDDHSKANDELKQIASKKGIDVPDKLSSKDEKLKAKLSKLNGAEFDRTYMDEMVKDHKKDVADFQRESSNGKDSDVKQFASKTLPTLQEHLQKAQSVAPTKTATSGTGAASK